MSNNIYAARDGSRFRGQLPDTWEDWLRVVTRPDYIDDFDDVADQPEFEVDADGKPFGWSFIVGKVLYAATDERGTCSRFPIRATIAPLELEILFREWCPGVVMPPEDCDYDICDLNYGEAVEFEHHLMERMQQAVGRFPECQDLVLEGGEFVPNEWA